MILNGNERGRIDASRVDVSDNIITGYGLETKSSVDDALNKIVALDTRCSKRTITSNGEALSATAYGNNTWVVLTGDVGTAFYASFTDDEWTSTTLPSSANWVDVVYGADKFVAIANATISTYATEAYVVGAYSTDGITWIESNLADFGDQWIGVAYGGGKYVAISSEVGTGAISTDGITWSSLSLPSTKKLTSIAYGNGRFVAVGSNITAYSTDGTNWTESTSYYNFNKIVFGAGKFTSGVYWSSDGVTWDWCKGGNNFTSIAYGDGKFVGINSYFSQVYGSYDGINWSTSDMGLESDWTDITYGDSGEFIVISTKNSTVYAIYLYDSIKFATKYDVSNHTHDAKNIAIKSSMASSFGLSPCSSLDDVLNVLSASKATADGDGNVITETYATKVELESYLPKATITFQASSATVPTSLADGTILFIYNE